MAGWPAWWKRRLQEINLFFFFWVKFLHLMVCVKAINVWRLATLQSYLNVPVSPWGVGEGSGGRRGPAAAQHLDTWELFARLQSLTNYAKHCGVKAASPLHLSPQICNVNSSLLFLSLGLIHLLDSFTPLMRVHPVCQLAPMCHLDSDSQLIAKAAVQIWRTACYFHLAKWLPAGLWFESGGRRAPQQLGHPFHRSVRPKPWGGSAFPPYPLFMQAELQSGGVVILISMRAGAGLVEKGSQHTEQWRRAAVASCSTHTKTVISKEELRCSSHFIIRYGMSKNFKLCSVL